MGKKPKIVKQWLISPVNNLLAFAFGRQMDLVNVVEYPKCGASWLSSMLRTYLGNRMQGTQDLIRRNAVLQHHCLYSPRLPNVVVVVRDPRDVWVSFYFHEVYLRGNEGLRAAIGFKEEDGDAVNLGRYIRYKLDEPTASSPGFSYAQFVESWEQNPGALRVTYEDLHRDAGSKLAEVLRYIGKEPDAEKVREVAETCSFQNKTGREPGQEVKDSHKRKGIIGDFRNYFSPELEALVRERQAGLFSKLGYG